MKLTINGIALHELGDVSILSQSSVFSNEEMSQKETRTLTIAIDFWEQSYHENYDLVTAARVALAKSHVPLVWQGDDEIVNEEEVAGPIYLNTLVDVVSHDLPENPNAWGTYQQQIRIVVRHEANRSTSDALKGTFKKTGALGAAIDLGNVISWKSSYRSQRNSEMRNDRSRAGGQVTAQGELLVPNTGDTLANRRVWLAAAKATLDTHVNGKDGTLTFGPSGQFFNQVVKVDAWDCDINQATTAIKWSLTVSYTIFPLEAGFAAADFRCAKNTDQESGDETLTIAGRVVAATEAIARTKMAAVISAALLSYSADGFSAANLVTSQVEPSKIDNDDTGGSAVFNELSFTNTYRKRAANVLSYGLSISDQEDTPSGLIQRTYSGRVTATGATQDAAYASAVAKARELGDGKHDFRIRGSITRTDRKTTAGVQEFVSIEFAYEYRLKAKRIYLEIRSDANTETFAENSEQVSGFVVAEDYATATAAYQSLVRSAYSSSLIRSERTSKNTSKIAKGSYNASNVFEATAGQYATMESGVEFSFNVLTQKGSNAWGIKYAVRVDYDDIALIKNTSVSGVFVGSAAEMVAAESGANGNALDTFLNALSYGTRVGRSRGSEHEKTTSLDYRTSVAFQNTYLDRISSAEQILECRVSEQIDYSGPRWVTQNLPDAPAVMQNCGVTAGARVITGEVKASTETAALAWIQDQNPENEDSIFHLLPTGAGGGDTPDDRYFHAPKIERDFHFIPRTDGIARGDDANAPCVRMTFTFAEVLPNFPYNPA